MNDELELLLVYYTSTGCLRAPLLRNTETIKWRKVHVPIAIILNNTMVKGLSIPIVRNKKSFERSIDTYKRFGEISIDSYRPKQQVW